MAQIGSRRQRRRGVRWLSHYSSAQTILVVGDGDLSFSLALAAAFGSGDNLVATSLDSYDALMSKYGKAESNVTELEWLGATVLHGVDAKTMKHHPCLKMRRFDRIVFNFPHAGFLGPENEDHMINAHQLLVRRFFRNASHLLHPDGEIHVSHKTGQPYDRWEIEELAYEFSLVMFEMVAFRKEDYPGYKQKRGDGERCDEEFSLLNTCTSKFCVESEEAEEEKFTAAQRESLHRLQESLDVVTNLHKEKEQQLLMLRQDDAGHAVAFQNSLGRGARKVALIMRDGTMHDDVLRAACSSRDDAVEEDTAGIEELQIECLEYGGATHCIHAAPSRWPYYDLSLVLLPFVALRVLELTGCNLHMYPPSPLDEKEDDNNVDDDDDDEDRWWRIVLPCLEVLWLRRCRTELGTLQGMVSAAPRLTDLRLEAVSFLDYQRCYRLHCPAATAIAMANCKVLLSSLHFEGCSVVLDAPRLRRFSYSQVVTFADDTWFSFDWRPPPHLEHVHIELHSASAAAAALRDSILSEVCHVHMRVLRFTAYSLTDLADDDLPIFHNLELLEIEELYGCIHAATASAVVNLLRCCPTVRELRLRFRWQEYLAEASDPADMMAAMADLTPCRSINSGDDEDRCDCCLDLDLDYQLCSCGLDCLKGSLRRVVVEFDVKDLTCFQVQLIRFLARNATSLEEVVVEGRKGYDSSRIDRKVERWRRRHRRSPLLPVSTSPAPPQWPPTLSEFPLPLKAPTLMPPTTCDGNEFNILN